MTKPDITEVEKKQKWLIDVAIPQDSRIDQKEVGKISNYQDLKVEVERLGKQRNISADGQRSLGSNTRIFRKAFNNNYENDKNL